MLLEFCVNFVNMFLCATVEHNLPGEHSVGFGHQTSCFKNITESSVRVRINSLDLCASRGGA